jgi:predicted GNAT family acetyltransferase
MDIARFVEIHRPALAANPVRHNILLSMMDAVTKPDAPAFGAWTLGGPGACAMMAPKRPVALGSLDHDQCRRLAGEIRDLELEGVVGSGPTAPWFAERAGELGVTFQHAIPQMIHVLRAAPRSPGARGEARLVIHADGEQFADWLMAFHVEAMPQASAPERANLVKTSGTGRYMFWIDNGAPVSVAGIVRNCHGVAAIGGVYTPPQLRERGYAGSVMAAVAERAFAQGANVVSLYTDLRNPASNRCYAKLGFEPVCESWAYLRG